LARQVPWARILAEGLAIVVSILLAFGIQAWWENRQDRSLEQQYLGRLSADLELGRAQLESQLERLGNAYEAARALPSILDGSAEPLTDDSLVQQFAIAARTGFLEASLDHAGTYRELQETGRLVLLSDVAFRQALADYYRRVEFVTQSTLQLNQGAARRFQQLTGQRAGPVWNNLSRLTPQDRTRLLRELRSSPDLQRDLREFSAAVTLPLSNLRSLQEQADTLLTHSRRLQLER